MIISGFSSMVFLFTQPTVFPLTTGNANLLTRSMVKVLDFYISAVRTLEKFLHTVTGLELMPGVVAVIQTFGDRINFHPHIHVLVTEGGTA